MSLADVDRIAEALLYEGYLLYPYRASSIKNRERFNFGVLYPLDDVEAQDGNDRASMQTECLVRGSLRSTVEVHLRFLHLLERRAEDALAEPAWHEAMRRDVSLPALAIGDLIEAPHQHAFTFEASSEFSAADDGAIVVRTQATVSGLIHVRAAALGNGLYRVTIVVMNTSERAGEGSGRIASLERSLASAHTVLVAQGGSFVSLLEPPSSDVAAAAACHNIGTWPVLAGPPGSGDTLLSSPIILYDYPEIAPESPGDLFDGAEIDEILSLRILTLTDDEKREMERTDGRARALLERTERLGAEDFMRMHGIMGSGERQSGRR